MTELDLAWLAGIIDGEGCIRIRKKSNKLHWFITILINSSDLYMIPHVNDLIPGTISRFCKSYGSDQLGWEITGKRAYYLLKDLLPYLRVKHEQAAKAIEFHETCKQRGQININQIQETFANEISSLKQVKLGNLTPII